MQGEIVSAMGTGWREAAPVPAGTSIAAWVRALRLDPRQPLIVAVNGDFISRSEWHRPLAEGQRVTAVLLPAFGGGGSGKVLRTLAMLAIAVAAAYAGPLIAGPALMGLQAGTTAFTVVSATVTAALTIGGGLLLNALLPAPKASSSSSGDAASPTYSVRASGNLARLGEQIPQPYGLVRLVPDYASQPFQEYGDDEQYLNQLFCLGLGKNQVLRCGYDDTVFWYRETQHAPGLASGDIADSGGSATTQWVKEGPGTLAATTVQGRPALAVTGTGGWTAAKTRIAVAGLADPETRRLSAVLRVEAQSGAGGAQLAFRELSGALAELRWTPVAVPAGAAGEAVALRQLTLLPDTVYLEALVVAQSGCGITVSGLRVFEGGLVADYDGIEVEEIPPGGTPTLFPGNVETSGEVTGQTLVPSDDGAWDWTGWFTCNAAGTTAGKLAADFALPLGLFDQDAGGLDDATVTWEVQGRRIDDDGAPLAGAAGDPVTLGLHSLTRATRSALRRTQLYPVPAGRWQMRARRSNAANGDNAADTLVWEGMKAYLPELEPWPHGTRLAVRARATNQISSVAQNRFFTVQQRLLRVRQSGAWVDDQPSRSIVWAFAEQAQNPVWGGGLPDARLNIAELEALDAIYTARGDSFDFIVDTRRSIWDVLRSIGRAGRAQPVQVGNILTLRRDQPKALADAVFTPASIRRGSFKLDYILQDDQTVDDVEVAFFDNLTGKPDFVTCTPPGSTSEAPQSLPLEGVGNRPQAWREGITEAVINQRRRTLCAFETEMQGRLLTRGDLVLVSHDLPRWGDFGEVTAWTAGTLTLVLSQPVTWPAGDPGDWPQHWMSLTRQNGREWGPVKVSRGATDSTLVIDPADHALVVAAQGLSADAVIELDRDRAPTQAIVGPGQAYLKRFLVVTARPRGKYTQLELVNEDPAVHTAEEGIYPDPVVASLLPTRRAGPLLEAGTLTVERRPDTPDGAPVWDCAFRAAPDATRYLAGWSSDGLAWTLVYEGTVPACALAVPDAMRYLRFAAFGTVLGRWVVWQRPAEDYEEEPDTSVIEIAISGTPKDQNLKTLALAAGWNGTDVITLRAIINAGARIGASATSGPALRSGASWPAGCAIVLVNHGSVYGAGGIGAGEGGFTTTGGPGGDAWWNEGVPCSIENYGTFAGGGGGGGKGQQRQQVGGGGGGTAVGGWGGGGRGDRGGDALTGSYPSGGSAAQEGSPSAAGKGGNGGVLSTLQAGKGGDGGGLGQAGKTGATGTGGNLSAGPYAGGAAGKYAKGDSYDTWTVAGTRLGGVSATL